MAGSVAITTYVEVLGSDPTQPLGSKSTPLSISLATDEEIVRFKRQLATGTTTEVLRIGSSAGDDITAFKVLAIKPEVETTVVLQGTNAADSSTVDILAGHVFVLSTDDTRVYDADAETRAGDTAQVITKVFALQSVQATAFIEILAAN